MAEERAEEQAELEKLRERVARAVAARWNSDDGIPCSICNERNWVAKDWKVDPTTAMTVAQLLVTLECTCGRKIVVARATGEDYEMAENGAFLADLRAEVADLQVKGVIPKEQVRLGPMSTPMSTPAPIPSPSAPDAIWNVAYAVARRWGTNYNCRECGDKRSPSVTGWTIRETITGAEEDRLVVKLICPKCGVITPVTAIEQDYREAAATIAGPVPKPERTVTGRFSSEPNLQRLPIPEAMGVPNLKDILLGDVLRIDLRGKKKKKENEKEEEKPPVREVESPEAWRNMIRVIQSGLLDVNGTPMLELRTPVGKLALPVAFLRFQSDVSLPQGGLGNICTMSLVLPKNPAVVPRLLTQPSIQWTGERPKERGRLSEPIFMSNAAPPVDDSKPPPDPRANIPENRQYPGVKMIQGPVQEAIKRLVLQRFFTGTRKCFFCGSAAWVVTAFSQVSIYALPVVRLACRICLVRGRDNGVVLEVDLATVEDAEASLPPLTVEQIQAGRPEAEKPKPKVRQDLEARMTSIPEVDYSDVEEED